MEMIASLSNIRRSMASKISIRYEKGLYFRSNNNGFNITVRTMHYHDLPEYAIKVRLANAGHINWVYLS